MELKNKIPPKMKLNFGISILIYNSAKTLE